MLLSGSNYPESFADLLRFLCRKYGVNGNRVFVEYSSRQPPPLRGGRAGYYDGLLSFREKDGQPEFLITVFSASRNPLLTLAHEFAHLVNNLKSGTYDKQLAPPNDYLERAFDNQAFNDLAQYRASTGTR